ncbi:MAG: hypothetical protein AB8B93_01230 [Pseudomonadales bacterium]
MESFLEKLLQPEVVWVVIPVIAILAVVGRKLAQRYFEHKERMAKIEAGIDPDANPEQLNS